MKNSYENQMNLVGAGVIWSFWEGTPPDLVLRCIQSMKVNNPNRPVIVLNKTTIHDYLDEGDFPIINGLPGNCDSFNKVQYLADWIRLTLLQKYGGIWLDASVICLGRVESWLSSDEEKMTMFPMHANQNIHGNWAMGSTMPGNPVVKAWKDEMTKALTETSLSGDPNPNKYINKSFEEFPVLYDLWNNPAPPPLPYLWPYLALQVALQRDPTLHQHIHLLRSNDGPMYRRYLNNPDGKPDEWISERTANHLAMFPLKKERHDRWFIKLVGSDRFPVQDRLTNMRFIAGSALHHLSRIAPVPIIYGRDLQDDDQDYGQNIDDKKEEIESLCRWAANCLSETTRGIKVNRNNTQLSAPAA